jgi:hypothetical protein
MRSWLARSITSSMHLDIVVRFFSGRPIGPSAFWTSRFVNCNLYRRTAVHRMIGKASGSLHAYPRHQQRRFQRQAESCSSSSSSSIVIVAVRQSCKCYQLVQASATAFILQGEENESVSSILHRIDSKLLFFDQHHFI